MFFLKSSKYILCSVVLGFTGNQCEININDCEDIVCPPKKVCVDLIDNYECRCPIGLTGDDCSIKIDPCKDNNCKNGATCSINFKTHDINCTCAPGFTGKTYISSFKTIDKLVI